MSEMRSVVTPILSLDLLTECLRATWARDSSRLEDDPVPTHKYQSGFCPTTMVGVGFAAVGNAVRPLPS